MSWYPDTLVTSSNIPANNLGMVVRPLGDGEGGAVRVSFVSGSLPAGAASQGTGVYLTGSGQTTVYTPTSGSLRLLWVSLLTPDYADGSDPTLTLATIRIGSRVIYYVPLTQPYVFSHSTVKEGSPGEVLSVELSVAASVYVNFDVEEF